MAVTYNYTTADEDFCTFDESNDFFTTCIKPEHIAEWRECARASDMELSLRLVDLGNQVAMLQLLARARMNHLPAGSSLLRPRFLHNHLRQAAAQIQAALGLVRPR